VPDVTPGGVVNVMAHGEVACNGLTCIDVQGWKTAETTKGIAISLVQYYTCWCAIPEYTPKSRRWHWFSVMGTFSPLEIITYAI